MEADFWHKRWASDEIGFHLREVNPQLMKYWPDLGLDPGSRVLVPLCGKSQDMLWLLEQGFRVVGIELSSIAAEAFFAENGITPRLTREAGYSRWSCDGLELLCGDFFSIQADAIGQYDGFYDRAALVALPTEMRTAYAQQLSCLAKQAACGLLVSFDYKQNEMNGPPFSIPEDEVRKLFDDHWNIHWLGKQDLLASETKFKERGLSRLEEQVFSLARIP